MFVMVGGGRVDIVFILFIVPMFFIEYMFDELELVIGTAVGTVS